MKRLIRMAPWLLLAGCSVNPSLVIYSQPEGAYITELESGSVLGVAPTVTYYDVNALQAYREAGTGCYLVKGFQAKWVSGAQSASPSVLRLCGATEFNITIARDASHPDLEKDLQFALQLQTVRAQQQQAQAAQNAAAAALFSAYSAAQPVKCSSQAIGDTVQTTCK